MPFEKYSFASFASFAVKLCLRSAYPVFRDSMSIEKRYFTSDLSSRS
jgi:hypothetical protein